MREKILCYGVQEIEKSIFKEVNKKFNFQLTLQKELLTDENAKKVKGYDAIILFVNCKADAKNLKIFKDNGVKHIVTRTAGYNHIDLEAAQKLGYAVANVPRYSPTAIATLAFTLGLSLLRKTAYMTYKAVQNNFIVDDHMFAKEVKNCTIGIIGTGSIGYETAKLWHDVGAKVLGFDPFQNDKAKSVLTYVTKNNEKEDETAVFKRFISQCDLISLHAPAVEENYDLINKRILSTMKPHSIIINTSRHELVNTQDVINSIKSNHLWGYAADVFKNEEAIINKNFSKKGLEEFPLIKELLSLYPRVLISPHVAYLTDEGVKNMAETSFENLQQLFAGKECKNLIIKKLRLTN